jgi:hypothetical protein
MSFSVDNKTVLNLLKYLCRIMFLLFQNVASVHQIACEFSKTFPGVKPPDPGDWGRAPKPPGTGREFEKGRKGNRSVVDMNGSLAASAQSGKF